MSCDSDPQSRCPQIEGEEAADFRTFSQDTEKFSEPLPSNYFCSYNVTIPAGEKYLLALTRENGLKTAEAVAYKVTTRTML
jgi:hypothetical protein